MKRITAEYLRSQGLSDTFETRFWSKVRKTETCWLWTGGGNPYGYIGTSGNNVISAHRASWILNFGPIPKGLNVLHHCPGKDNPKCVNPNHLYLGTQSDNSFDAIRNGRKYAHGEMVTGAKLTNRQALYVRNLHRSGSTLVRLARSFHVSTTTIRWIVKNWSYKTRP